MSNLNAYPAPQTPLSGTEAIVAAQTQSGVAKTVTMTLAQMGTYFIAGIANFVDAETPAGPINGVNTIFTLANTPLSNSMHLFLNGVRQRPTTDYSVTGNTITYTSGAKPQTGDNHLADYRI